MKICLASLEDKQFIKEFFFLILLGFSQTLMEKALAPKG
jgi:hypothetical protein